MPISKGLFTNVISSILDFTAGKAWKTLTRKEKVLKILNDVGLKPDESEPTFESVYAHALVEYGVTQPREPVLNFFRLKDIQDVFKRSFERNVHE